MPPKSLKNIRRAKPVNMDQSDLVAVQTLNPGNPLPLVIRPKTEGLNLVAWGEANRKLIGQSILEKGGVLFRGFKPLDSAGLSQFVEAVSGQTLEYKERSSPRTAVKGNVYTSTEHPSDQHIFLHNENSYQFTWPMKVFFLCEIEPETGGETPIADCRRVLARIDPQIRARFEKRGFRIVRNFSKGMGLDWKTVFNTNDRTVVEAYCKKNLITPEWKADGGLRTSTLRPPTARHPITGEETWFNHGTFFHVSTLEPAVRDVLLNCLAPEDLPTNTYYGDGAPIEEDVIDHLRQAYQQETISFPWKKGDLMILDNMLAAHGRAPFSGDRKILVAMSEPMNRA